MKTPVHKISIANSIGTYFDIINVGEFQNKTLGVESIVLNRTKDDINEECVITIKSKYDVNGVIKLEDENNTLKITNQLPTDSDIIPIGDDLRSRFTHFDYEVGDMALVQFAYNENGPNELPEVYFGFIKSINSVDDKKVVITLQNQSYLLKKILYNFSQKEMPVKELMSKLIGDYNTKFNEIYGQIIADLRSANATDLANNFEAFGTVEFDENLVNVDYTIKNFRAENITSIDIFEFLKKNYFTKSSFFQLVTDRTFYIGGFLNLFQISETDNLPDSLKSFLNFNFVFKNYDLYYDTIGLNDAHIIDEIRKQPGNENINEDTSFLQVILNKQLSWQNAKDVVVRINFKVVDRNNAVKKSAYGDNGGQTKTVVYFEPKTDDQLKALSEEYVDDLKYTGYKRGSSITTYGNPSVSIFDEIYVIDVFQNAADATTNPYELVVQKYLVESVNLNYSTQGLRQTVTFGSLLSSNIKVDDGVNKNIVFKTEGIQNFVPSQTNDSPGDAKTKEVTFTQDLSDIQLLSKIDRDISEMIANSDLINSESTTFFERVNTLKTKSPRGYFTTVFGQKEGAKFTPESLGFGELLGPFGSSNPLNNETTKGTKSLQDAIKKIIADVRLRQSSLEAATKNGRQDLVEAANRGLNVDERQVKYNDAFDIALKASLEANKVLTFDNNQ